jgi:Domain of unknown function (DUF3850)
MPSEHVLKTWPVYFTRLVTGEKNFDVRLNDRSYQAGDTLILREYDPSKDHECDRQDCVENRWTGRELTFRVGFAYTGDGVADKYVVMSLLPID